MMIQEAFAFFNYSGMDMERTEKKKNLILPALILLLGLAYILWAVPLQGGNLDSRILLFLQENIRNQIGRAHV